MRYLGGRDVLNRNEPWHNYGTFTHVRESTTGTAEEYSANK